MFIRISARTAITATSTITTTTSIVILAITANIVIITIIMTVLTDITSPLSYLALSSVIRRGPFLPRWSVNRQGCIALIGLRSPLLGWEHGLRIDSIRLQRDFYNQDPREPNSPM